MSDDDDDESRTRPVVAARVDPRVNRELEGLIEEKETKSDVAREVIRQGVQAYQLDAEPDELREHADELEQRVERLKHELDRDAWDRLGPALKGVFFFASLAVASVIFAAGGILATEVFGSGLLFDTFLRVGLAGVAGSLVALVALIIFLMYRTLREAIEPDV